MGRKESNQTKQTNKEEREQVRKVMTGKKKFNLIEVKTTTISSFVVIFASVSIKYLPALARTKTPMSPPERLAEIKFIFA